MKKLRKPLPPFKLVQLSPLLALTRAQADQLDDVQTKADKAGVSLTVEDKSLGF